jgi:serine protease AprX
MAAPVVAGGAALLLERFPHLTPDQIKGLLVGSARRYVGQTDQAGALDLQEAMLRASRGAFTPANSASIPSIFVAPITVSAELSGPTTTSAYWDQAYWDSAYWDSAYWDAAYWDAAYWDVSRSAD